MIDKTIQKALGLQMNGFQQEALNIYRKALTKAPDNDLLNEHYGSALAATGQLKEAKKYLKRALRNTVVKPQVLNNLATVNRGLRLFEEALVNVQSALKFKPSYVDAWINRANLHVDLKQWDQAIDCFKEAIKLHPSDRFPHLNLANTYLRKGDFDAALDVYQFGQKQFSDPLFFTGELICYRAMEKYQKALKFAEQLKEKHNNELMWFEWVQTLWLAKEYDKFKDETDKAIEKFGRFPALMSLLELSGVNEPE